MIFIILRCVLSTSTLTWGFIINGQWILSNALSESIEMILWLFFFLIFIQFSSVAQSCLTLCDPMNCSAPGLPVHHHLPEFTQTHVHRVNDAIQTSRPLSSPLLMPSVFPSIRIFSSESLLWIRWPKHWSFRFIISPSNKHSGMISFRMGWLDLKPSKGLPRIFSNTTVQKHNSLVLSLLHGPSLTSTHDYWKNHSFG